MESKRILPGQPNPPSQLTGAQQKSGEEAFHDMAKSKGSSKEDLAAATNERTRLTRAQRAERNKGKQNLLVLLNDNDDLEGKAVYRTVMVDGILFTLRLLAVA